MADPAPQCHDGDRGAQDNTYAALAALFDYRQIARAGGQGVCFEEVSGDKRLVIGVAIGLEKGQALRYSGVFPTIRRGHIRARLRQNTVRRKQATIKRTRLKFPIGVFGEICMEARAPVIKSEHPKPRHFLCQGDGANWLFPLELGGLFRRLSGLFGRKLWHNLPR